MLYFFNVFNICINPSFVLMGMGLPIALTILLLLTTLLSVNLVNRSVVRSNLKISTSVANNSNIFLGSFKIISFFLISQLDQLVDL
jgi:hypothetical protein